MGASSAFLFPTPDGNAGIDAAATGVVSNSADSSFLVSPAPLASSPDVKAPGGALDLNFPSSTSFILQTAQELTSV
jgi:hypothetical protein